MPRNIQPDIERVHRRLSGVLEECTPGDRLPSYGRLMARCRCSRRVLERALELLRSEELIRIEPQKGIFVRKRPEPDERRIVIVHTDWASEYWQTLDAKFEQAFAAHPGYRLSRMLFAPGTGVDFCRRLNRKLADAVLLTYAFTDSSQADVARLLSSDVPLIFLENHISCRGLAAIDSEPEYTGMLAADCLLRNGHRRIAVVFSGNIDLCVHRENDGFIRYLQLHGVTPQLIDCRHVDGESALASTEEAIGRYLRKHGVTFTGCFVQGVFAARGIYRAAASLGYSIPGDFSVIANSEVPSAAHCKPPLTTVARDFDGYAREVLAGLEELFQGRPFGVRRVPSLLIERGSVRNLNFSASSTSEKRS